MKTWLLLLFFGWITSQVEGICSNGFRFQCDPINKRYFCRLDVGELPQFSKPYEKRLTSGNIGFQFPLNQNAGYSCPANSHFSKINEALGLCLWDVVINSNMKDVIADFSSFHVGTFAYGFTVRDTFNCNEANEVLYYLKVDYLWLNPDGVYRQIIAINDLLPGPELRVKWNQNISVTVQNNLPTESITIHWHGMPQQGTNVMDGVPYITQLPILPGKSFTYRFNATRWGTHWYHSHSGAQYGDGLFGALIVENPNDPYKYKYHEERVLVLTEWFWRSSPEIISELKADVHQPDYFPVYESTLINGKARVDCCDPKVPSTVPINRKNQKMEMWKCKEQDYARFDVEQGKKYRFRIIGANSGTTFNVSIDFHKMVVIAVDGVDVKQKRATVNSITVFVAQRYDVIVKANQPVGCYWLRVATLSSDKYMREESKALICYNNVNVTATSVRYKDFRTIDDLKDLEVLPSDPAYLNLIPADQLQNYTLNIWCSNSKYECAIGVNDSTPIPFHLPSSPVLLDLALGKKPQFPQPMITLQTNKWIMILLQNYNSTMSHPFHLHGHHFYYLGKGKKGDRYNSSQLMLRDPIVRDTVQIEEDSWLAFAFFTNNPGVWFFHCHIEWHLEAGLALLFYEKEDTDSTPLWHQLPDDLEILQTVREARTQKVCHYKQHVNT